MPSTKLLRHVAGKLNIRRERNQQCCAIQRLELEYCDATFLDEHKNASPEKSPLRRFSTQKCPTTVQISGDVFAR